MVLGRKLARLLALPRLILRASLRARGQTLLQIKSCSSLSRSCEAQPYLQSHLAQLDNVLVLPGVLCCVHALESGNANQ